MPNLNETDDFDRQTAVTDSLPYACHRTKFTNWRERADELIFQLRERGYEIIRIVYDNELP